MFLVVKFEQDAITSTAGRHAQEDTYTSELTHLPLLQSYFQAQKEEMGCQDESGTPASRIRKHSGSEYSSRAVDLGLHLFTLDRTNKACLAGLFGVPRGHTALHAPCNVTVMKPCSGHRWNLVLAGSQPSPVLQCPWIDGGRLGRVSCPGGRRLRWPLGPLLVMQPQLEPGNMQPSSGPVNH